MFKKVLIKLIKKIQKKNQPNKFEIVKSKLNNYHLISDTKFNNEINLKIITSHDDNYKQIGDITTKSMLKYADRFNLKFKFLDMPDTGRVQTWNKILQIKDEIQKKEDDYIMWVDADAFFPNDAENILSVIDNKYEIYLSSHYCSVFKGSNYKNTILTTNRINCGVMIFKVNDFCLKFLENVWNKKEYINHFWYEQAAIMDLVGLKADITGNLKDNKGNDFYLNKIKFLSKEWNSIPSFGAISSESIRPSIIHLAGIDNNDRLKLLNDYIKRGKI
tara:strand:+ start:29 stop:853 length:825 start_codon:yes stop_codon:yes gene_type:complete